MKIAFFTFYSGYLPRGVETFVHEVASRLGKRHEVRVFQGGPPLPDSVNYETVRIHTPVDWSQKDTRYTIPRFLMIDYWSQLVKLFTLRALGKLGEADVVVPTNGGWQSFLTRLWTRKEGKKMVITGHSGPGFDDRLNLLVRPDVFVGLTDYQVSWARRNGFGVKVAKIPNGIDLEKFSSYVKPIKVNLPKPVFLYAGALERNKRVDLIIRAVAKLKRGSLLVVGDGELKGELQKTGDELLPGRFKVERTTHDKMPAYYAAGDIFVYATIPNEAFGLVLLEAMASGLPVVAPDDPIRREIVGEGGLFVNPTDTEQYSRALERALSLEWGQRPLQQAQKFSWDGVAQRYEELFRSIIK